MCQSNWSNWKQIRYWLLFATLICGWCEGKEKPNVLFIICDDLNCDLGCYGHPMVQSPNIDGLARRGVRFENAHCQYPLCGPSRASFMTGLYPDQTLIHQNAVFVRERVPNVTTLAQLFRRAGYTATRIGKIFHYGVPGNIGSSGHDDPYSWDFTFNPRGRDKDEEYKVFSLVPGSFGGTLSWHSAAGADEEQTDGIGATEAVRQLEKFAERGTPFFLAVGLYRPHTPYVAPHKYFQMYDPQEVVVPVVPEGYFDSLPEPAKRPITKRRKQFNLVDDLKRKAIQAYYASITFADAQVGRILQALEATGLAKNTIVVFTSDHGYHMGEHGHFQKTTLFENATRVPLIFSVPGKVTGSTSSFAEMVDFYPTLAELCGLQTPEYIAGVSLAPVLDDLSATPRQTVLTQFASGYSLRQGDYRYTAWGPGGKNGSELYDHRSDPGEMHNLAGDPELTEVQQRLAKQLAERVAEARSVPNGIDQKLDWSPRRDASLPARSCAGRTVGIGSSSPEKGPFVQVALHRYCSDWQQLHAFGREHLTVLSLIVGLSILVPWSARKFLAPAAQVSVGWFLGVLTGMAVVSWTALHGLAGTFQLERHLPLHLCYIVALLAPIVMVTRNQRLFELFYYCTFSGGLQACFSPDECGCFPHFECWRFWLIHGGAIVCAVYAIVVFRLWPTSGGIRDTWLAILAYLLVVLLLNWMLGTNYFYVCAKPPQSPLDLMGPWPWYVLLAIPVAYPLIATAYIPIWLINLVHAEEPH